MLKLLLRPVATRLPAVTQRPPLEASPSVADADRAAVICRGVTKHFGQGETMVRALRGVDLRIEAGEMTLLAGPSGCGKTTLISILAGLLDPTAGSVQVLGTNLGDLTGRALVRFRAARIGFVFQQYNLLPALSAAENAAIPLLIRGVERREAIARAREQLAAVDLTNRAHARPVEMSGGQQQRVAIARALASEPQLLVCDEPTAALDARSGQTVMELLRRVAVQPGRAVIIVTHDSRVMSLGDRIIHMNDGVVDRIEEPRARGREPG